MCCGCRLVRMCGTNVIFQSEMTLPRDVVYTFWSRYLLCDIGVWQAWMSFRVDLFVRSMVENSGIIVECHVELWVSIYKVFERYL